MYRRPKQDKGFTLIEMLVSVALFSVVMLIAGATLLSLVYANRKAQALQSVMNNLNITLDDMVRNVRMGSNYRCGSESAPTAPNFGDCSSGGTSLYFTPFGEDPTNSADDIGYLIGTGGACAVGRICVTQKGQNGVVETVPISAPEVQITNMKFYVIGTNPAVDGGTIQPKVLFTITGQAGLQANTKTTFQIQATAVQRVLNL
jgi:prepilin-type N-terminal cleavage/methylation domain-containing protein